MDKIPKAPVIQTMRSASIYGAGTCVTSPLPTPFGASSTCAVPTWRLPQFESNGMRHLDELARAGMNTVPAAHLDTTILEKDQKTPG